MLAISVPLAFVAMATMPLVVWTGIRMRKSMFPVSWLIQARLADVATIVDENINGVRVVKSFAAEQHQLTKLAKAADRLRSGPTSRTPTSGPGGRRPSRTCRRLGLALVLLFGGYMVIHGHFSVGAIVAFNSYLLMLQPPFMLLGMVIMMGQRAAASAEPDLRGPRRAAHGHRSPGRGRPGRMRGRGCVRPRGLRLQRRRRSAAGTSISASVPGETVALVGRTGSGKSTVARLLTRFYDVTGGAVRVDGHDVRDLTLASLRAQVGIGPRRAVPVLGVGAGQHRLRHARRPTSPTWRRPREAAGADEFIRELSDGYDTVVGERGYTLSGGQRQRIAIARTLLVNPPVLILDDATSAIDVQVEQQIHAALRLLMDGRTTLIIAHRLSTISLADRVVLIDGGRVVADGTHAELLATTPLYGEVLAQAEQDAAERDAEERDAEERDAAERNVAEAPALRSGGGPGGHRDGPGGRDAELPGAPFSAPEVL